MLFTPPSLRWIIFSVALLSAITLQVAGLLGLPLPLDPNDLTKLLTVNYLGNVTQQLSALYSTLYNFGEQHRVEIFATVTPLFQ